MSGTQTLRRLVRLDVAKELTFTGRIISGTEAERLGLVTRVVDSPRPRPSTPPATSPARSPDAIRAAKALLNASGLTSLSEGLALEEKYQRGLLGTANQTEAVMANVERGRRCFATRDARREHRGGDRLRRLRHMAEVHSSAFAPCAASRAAAVRRWRERSALSPSRRRPARSATGPE